jgi:hypothetical protein
LANVTLLAVSFSFFGAAFPFSISWTRFWTEGNLVLSYLPGPFSVLAVVSSVVAVVSVVSAVASLPVVVPFSSILAGVFVDWVALVSSSIVSLGVFFSSSTTVVPSSESSSSETSSSISSSITERSEVTLSKI